MTPDLRTRLAAFKTTLDMSFKTIPGGMGLEKENIEQWGCGYAPVRVQGSALLLSF